MIETNKHLVEIGDDVLIKQNLERDFRSLIYINY